jgi:hypothetical protein
VATPSNEPGEPQPKPMPIYPQLHLQYSHLYELYKKRFRQIVYLLFFLVSVLVFSIYQFIATGKLLYACMMAFSFAFYLWVLHIQDIIRWKRDLAKQQIAVNENEIQFLDHHLQPFADGKEFEDPHHPYSGDLDIFGMGSLFQHLNRTATHTGKTILAHRLTNLLPSGSIREQQEAISELAPQVAWRQRFQSIALLIKDTKDTYEKLIRWSGFGQNPLQLIIRIASFALPVLFWISFVFLLLKGTSFWFNCTTAIFILNNGILATQLKKIRRELIDADRIDQLLKGYGKLLAELESKKFNSICLIRLQEDLKTASQTAGNRIKALSSIFNSLTSIENVFGAAILNGSCLFHLHILHKLFSWKNRFAGSLKIWLETIGQMEALNSFANFCFNNPGYCFPELNNSYQIGFKNAGHPLIPVEKRICNDIQFRENSLMILSGSNMSGKSTFLRTAGINMVLTGIGAPVCASEASVHSLPVYTSMRLSDSLTDNESYFFAEIKRLQWIRETLRHQVVFVLLDEILRGTNSDDKQHGTMKIIKRLTEQRAIGILATHDLEVCATAMDDPQHLFNKCFEVEIIQNNLQFDYILRDGFCKNRSASFLMEKLGII